MKIDDLMIIPERNNLKSSISLAKEFDCGFEYNDFFFPNVLEDEELQKEIINLYKAENDLPSYTTLHGAFFDVTVFSDDPLIKAVSDKRVEQSISIGRMLGVKGIIFHTNYTPNFNLESYRDNWVKRNAVYWREKLTKYKDIDIYIENMFDTDYELIKRLGEELEDVDNFGICLDYAHAHVFGNQEYIESWVTNLAPYVKHIHINDNDFVSDLHLPVGTGNIDWKKFKEYYQQYFSKASVLLEVTGYEKSKQSLEFIKQL